MFFGKYCFSCSVQEETHLPEYKGSTFRGVFGHALKRVLCALKRHSCDACLLRSTCIYAYVFESGNSGEGEISGKRRPAPVHPFVIEPPDEKKTVYRPGDGFDFNLILFGKANEYLSHFICAFEQIGSSGIGRRINGKPGTFRLESVESGGGILYSSHERRIRKIDSVEDIQNTAFSQGCPEDRCLERVTVSLKTPLRLKYQNRLEPDLPFHILIRAANRRISSLFNQFGEGEPQIDYRALVKKAEKVNVVESSIRWFDWRRYSNRQEQAMFMGGMTGDVVYEKVPVEFIPLLRFVQAVHLGKQTTFGLGRIELTLDGRHDPDMKENSFP